MPRVIKLEEGLEILEEVRDLAFSREVRDYIYAVVIEYLDGRLERWVAYESALRGNRVASQIAQIIDSRMNLDEYVLNLTNWVRIEPTRTVIDYPSVASLPSLEDSYVDLGTWKPSMIDEKIDKARVAYLDIKKGIRDSSEGLGNIIDGIDI